MSAFDWDKVPGIRKGTISLNAMVSHPPEEAADFRFIDMREYDPGTAAFTMKTTDGRIVYAPVNEEMVRILRDAMGRWLNGEPMDGES